MSSPFSPAQLAELEGLLRSRQRQLDRRLDEQRDGQSRAEHAREVLLQDGDDAPQRDADREVDLALSDMEVAELGAVNAALQRLAAGQYGACAECGQAVPFARLKLEPHALRCVACESARERGQPRPATM